ncbi:peptidase S11 [Ramlibacter sp. G-1-2-2]|uniref:Peptidase S11 n=1 Tax=Ramlibacter agri TaxID=2728837 RepID=A0A848HFQ1_9BURK|nr:serine hydrolase [Ramlibacter agri]NML47353.1 peptidase S11 [Ramlibacter agri]
MKSARLLPLALAIFSTAWFVPAEAQAATAHHAHKPVHARPAAAKPKAHSATRHVAARAKPAPQPVARSTVPQELAVRATSALVIDPESDQVLYGKNATSVQPIASLTKLMTGLVIDEAKLPMDEEITIADEDVDRLKFSSSHLPVGTRLTRNEALHLALMSSENRAAHALGRTYPGGLAAFVDAMNNKAQQLGMKNTKYVEPTGLSSANQSTARDLATLVEEAADHPVLREFSTSTGYQLDAGKRSRHFGSTNPLVRDPLWKITLQKTGYIREAGQCLILEARMAGRKLIMVFLDSAGNLGRIKDAQAVRKWLDSRPELLNASSR